MVSQGALSKKKAKEEKMETFLAKVKSVSLYGKNLTDIVQIRILHQVERSEELQRNLASVHV